MPDKTKEVVLDFSGVKPFEAMNPERRYLCRTTGFTLGTAASSKQPKASLELTIVQPEMTEVVDIDGKVQVDPKGGGNAVTKAAGRKLFREFSLQSQALPFLYEYLKAVDPSVELGDSFRLRPDEYLGLECAVSIQNEEFEEQIRPRVRRIYPASRYPG